MSGESISAAAVREALHAGRYGKPMRDSTLLELTVVTERLRGTRGTPTADDRARVLLEILAEVLETELSTRRGGHAEEAVPPSDEDGHLRNAAADFEAGRLDLEALTTLQLRYLSGLDDPLRRLADVTGTTRRTLRRRVERG